MPYEDAALNILTTVVDRPEAGVALIDAGSKVLSSDRNADGISGRGQDIRTLVINRFSEEHGFLGGDGVDSLSLGQRLRFQPSHVCPVVNLASKVFLVRDGQVLDIWPVDARGRSD
jgi:D-serine deaminase-like pyridoxal phosphate-dependent protein